MHETNRITIEANITNHINMLQTVGNTAEPGLTPNGTVAFKLDVIFYASRDKFIYVNQISFFSNSILSGSISMLNK